MIKSFLIALGYEYADDSDIRIEAMLPPDAVVQDIAVALRFNVPVATIIFAGSDGVELVPRRFLVHNSDDPDETPSGWPVPVVKLMQFVDPHGSGWWIFEDTNALDHLCVLSRRDDFPVERFEVDIHGFPEEAIQSFLAKGFGDYALGHDKKRHTIKLCCDWGGDIDEECGDP